MATKKKSSANSTKTATKRTSTEKKVSEPVVQVHDTTENSPVNWIRSMTSQERLIGIMVIVLVIAAFFLGYFYGQLTVLKGGSNLLAAGNNAAPTAPQPQQAEEQPLTEEQWNLVLENPAATRGDPNAPITMVEFTDYECPFCSRHVSETDPMIQENYVDSGQVFYVIRDLPLPFHPAAEPAAQAARCAGDQDAYWEMHDELFANQEGWSTATDPSSEFSAYASSLGLNVSTFDSCMESGKYAQAVQDDLALASQVGANGTPSFFINGQPLVGAQPYAAFEALIESQL